MKLHIFLFLLALTIFSSSCTDITNVTPEQIDEIVVKLNRKTLSNNGQLLFVVNHHVISDSLFRHIKLVHIDSVAGSKDPDAIKRYSEKPFHGLLEIFGNEKILTDLKPDTSKSSNDN